MMPLRSAAMATTPATSLRATPACRASSMTADGLDCWALAANGNAAAPPTSEMNSRRFIGSFLPFDAASTISRILPAPYHCGARRRKIAGGIPPTSAILRRSGRRRFHAPRKFAFCRISGAMGRHKSVSSRVWSSRKRFWGYAKALRYAKCVTWRDSVRIGWWR